MTARARVRRVENGRWIDLSILSAPRCGGCRGMCMWGWKPPSSLRLRDFGHHRPGDLVSLSLRNRHALRGTLSVHGMPWAGLLVGTVAGSASLGGDLGALLGAVVGLAFGLVVGRSLQGHWRVRPDMAKVDDY